MRTHGGYYLVTAGTHSDKHALALTKGIQQTAIANLPLVIAFKTKKLAISRPACAILGRPSIAKSSTRDASPAVLLNQIDPISHNLNMISSNFFYLKAIARLLGKDSVVM